jgi:hypothetical protein
MSDQPPAAPPQPGTSGQIRVPTRLATAAIVVATLLVVLQLASFVTSWASTGPYREAARTGSRVDDIVTAYDYVKLAFTPTILVALVVSCLWLGRSRTNVDIARPDYPHARSTFWVWLGWWVPVLSLWYPYQVVRDVRAASFVGRPPDLSVFGWWWCWLGWIVMWRVAYGLVPASGVPDADSVYGLGFVEGVATIALLIAYRQWVRIIRQVTKAQQELAR